MKQAYVQMIAAPANFLVMRAITNFLIKLFSHRKAMDKKRQLIYIF